MNLWQVEQAIQHVVSNCDKFQFYEGSASTLSQSNLQAWNAPPHWIKQKAQDWTCPYHYEIVHHTLRHAEREREGVGHEIPLRLQRSTTNLQAYTLEVWERSRRRNSRNSSCASSSNSCRLRSKKEMPSSCPNESSAPPWASSWSRISKFAVVDDENWEHISWLEFKSALFSSLLGFSPW